MISSVHIYNLNCIFWTPCCTAAISVSVVSLADHSLCWLSWLLMVQLFYECVSDSRSDSFVSWSTVNSAKHDSPSLEMRGTLNVGANLYAHGAVSLPVSQMFVMLGYHHWRSTSWTVPHLEPIHGLLHLLCAPIRWHYLISCSVLAVPLTTLCHVGEIPFLRSDQRRAGVSGYWCDLSLCYTVM